MTRLQTCVDQGHGRIHIADIEVAGGIALVEDPADNVLDSDDMVTDLHEGGARQCSVEFGAESEMELIRHRDVLTNIGPKGVCRSIDVHEHVIEFADISIGLGAREGYDYRFLVPKVVVESGSADACLGGDLRQRDRVITVLRHQPGECLKHTLTCLFTMLIERSAHDFRHCRNLLDVTPSILAAEAADALRQRTGGRDHDIALVMGSGWLPAADALGAPDYEFPYTELPGFSAPAVEGHGGAIRSVTVGGSRVLIFLGRTHFYEGRGVAAVVHGVRTAAAAGVKTMILTNGCGGLNPAWTPGTPVLIKDHINLTATSPIEGAHFVDLTDLYSPRLRAMCREVDPSLDEGVYCQFPGPHYETPAEINMVRAIGGDLVGMSTVLEAIAAREAGMEVLGLSLVTNLAAGISGEPLNHAEVLAAGKAAAARMGGLLAQILPRI